VREMNAHAVPAREREHAVEVVAVLVGDEDRRKAARLEPEAAETALGFSQAEAAVDQQPGGARLYNQRIAAAAAAERREPQAT